MWGLQLTIYKGSLNWPYDDWNSQEEEVTEVQFDKSYFRKVAPRRVSHWSGFPLSRAAVTAWKLEVPILSWLEAFIEECVGCDRKCFVDDGCSSIILMEGRKKLEYRNKSRPRLLVWAWPPERDPGACTIKLYTFPFLRKRGKSKAINWYRKTFFL